MKNKFNIFILITISIVLGFSGCSATGAKFQKLEKPVNDKALVYFYRPDIFSGGGVSFNIMSIDMDSNKTGLDSVNKSWKLRNNSYIKESLKAGTYALTTNWMYNPKKFVFKANKINCVRMDVTFANSTFSKHPELIFISDESECIKGLQGTKIMTQEDQESMLY